MRHLLLDLRVYFKLFHAEKDTVKRWKLLDKPTQDIPREILEAHTSVRVHDPFPMEVYQPNRRTRTQILPV